MLIDADADDTDDADADDTDDADANAADVGADYTDADVDADADADADASSYTNAMINKRGSVPSSHGRLLVKLCVLYMVLMMMICPE